MEPSISSCIARTDAAAASCSEGCNLSPQGANFLHVRSPGTFTPKCLPMTNRSYPSASIPSQGPVVAVPAALAEPPAPWCPVAKLQAAVHTAALGDYNPENAKEKQVPL